MKILFTRSRRGVSTLFFKSYVKPHTRRLASGKVVQVGGYNNKRFVRGKGEAGRTGNLFDDAGGKEGGASGKIAGKDHVSDKPMPKLPKTISIDGVERPTTNSAGRPIHPTAAELLQPGSDVTFLATRYPT